MNIHDDTELGVHLELRSIGINYKCIPCTHPYRQIVSQKLNYVALFGSTSAYWEAGLRLRSPSTLFASLFVLWCRRRQYKNSAKHIMGHIPDAFLREVRTPWWTILTSPRRNILTAHASFDAIRPAKFLRNALPILENTTAMLTAALAIPANILRHLLWVRWGRERQGRQL